MVIPYSDTTATLAATPLGTSADKIRPNAKPGRDRPGRRSSPLDYAIRGGVAGAVLFSLCGCLADDIPPLTVAESRPKNLIERALVVCADKTIEAESACVRTALDGSGLSPAALAAVVPGCRIGQVCLYDYTTEDRVGYLSAYATHLRYGFRLAFDFSQHPRTVAAVPVTLKAL